MRFQRLIKLAMGFFFTLSQTIHDVNFLRNTQHLYALCFNSNVLSIVVKRNDICNSGDFARTEMNIHVVLSTELWIKTGSYVFMRISQLIIFGEDALLPFDC